MKKKEKKKRKRKMNSHKSVTWSAVPDAPLLVYVSISWAAVPEGLMTYDSMLDNCRVFRT